MSQDICYNETSHHEWVSQGFEEAPFDDKKLNFCHYRSQGFIHALNQLATLDTTAVCLSHIYGESGSGKTSCLKSFQKMFGVETMEHVIATINGTKRFYGLTETDLSLKGLDKHIALVESYKKLHTARAKRSQTL